MNLILSTDSYKTSHWKQYPPGTRTVSSYVESRGGEFRETVFFGLQAYLKEYLTRRVKIEDVEEARDVFEAHGVPFNYGGWKRLVEKHDGRMPLKIQAVPEGTVMPTGNVQVQVMNTDPEFYWLTSYMETALLRAVWYPSTVATQSREAKRYIGASLSVTSDIPVKDQLPFKLHDFGARGVSSSESAMLGGMAHLVNFMGTDTVESLLAAKKYYGEPMAGFSIPASEHSTMTAWGRNREVDAYRNMLEVYSGEGKLFACVSDSYDIWNAVRNIWSVELREQVKNSGGTLVIRPDSGDPVKTPLDVIEILMDKFGYKMNSKLYRVLPDYVRVIQGDGIDIHTLRKILLGLEARGLSADNIAFGMGGGLLQQVNRDTLKYAMKCSAIQDQDGRWIDVYKDPVGGNKTSKRGRLGLIYNSAYGSHMYQTVPEEVAEKKGNLLETVFQNGYMMKEHTFAEIRKRADVDFDLKPREPVSRYD